MFGEQGCVGDLFRGNASGGEFFQVDAVNMAGISGRDERGVGVEQEEVENGIDRERDAGDGRAIADEVERALRGRAGEEGPVGEGFDGVDLRIVEFDEFARGVGGEGGIVGDLEDFSVGPGADEELRGVSSGLDAPEEIGGSGNDEFSENGARHEPAIRAGGEAFEAAAGDVAEKIDVGFLRERIGWENGGENQGTRERDEKRAEGRGRGEPTEPTEDTEGLKARKSGHEESGAGTTAAGRCSTRKMGAEKYRNGGGAGTASLHNAEGAADSGGGQFAGEDVAFPEREEGITLAKTSFVGGAGDAFDGARGLGRRDGLVAENFCGFDDG